MSTKYRTAPEATTALPRGIPYIIGNEAAERFSFYGMRGILVIFMTQYLFYLPGSRLAGEMPKAEATATYHFFTTAVYFFPIFGALLADVLLGKYRTILSLSIVYCLGHASLALMGHAGAPSTWLLMGLLLISIGSGGIKPCVSAHVGDQFGKTNGHLLPRVFGWFYFSINTGAFLSFLITPWLLEWHGPHWAFGVPGVLMAIATIAFWMGRKVFIHVPPGGMRFIRETFSREGMIAIAKLLIIYAFVAIFWALFDQTGSSWVLQAEDMNRRWLGVTWLSSQIGAVNPIMILVFIPLFQFVIYPLVNRVFTLTPMRKISLGLFVMAGGFAIIAVAQQLIDAGQRPSIGWQIIAYAVLTASEVMVSITCLEFSYTQSPRTMKSVVMALFFMSVSAGNLFTAAVNQFILVPDGLQRATVLVQPLAAKADGDDLDLAVLEQRSDKLGVRLERADQEGFRVTIPAADGDFDSPAAVAVDYSAGGERQRVTTVENDKLDAALQRIKNFWQENETLPSAEQGQALIGGMHDTWSNPLRYELVTSKQFRISSNGADELPLTADDINLKVVRLAKTAAEIEIESQVDRDLLRFLHPEKPWLARRKAELAADEAAAAANGSAGDDVAEAPAEPFQSTITVGGEQKLAGAQYFWFFTKVMLGTAICFLLVAWLYRPQTYLQEEVPADEIASEATSNQ